MRKFRLGTRVQIANSPSDDYNGLQGAVRICVELHSGVVLYRIKLDNSGELLDVQDKFLYRISTNNTQSPRPNG